MTEQQLPKIPIIPFKMETLYKLPEHLYDIDGKSILFDCKEAIRELANQHALQYLEKVCCDIIIKHDKEDGITIEEIIDIFHETKQKLK